MASTVTLLSMRNQARQRADMENSTFVSDSELTGYINSSIKDLYDRLQNAGEFYNLSSSNISIVGNTDTYSLPSDFYKLQGVDLVVDALGNGVTLKPFQFSQRNSYLFTPTWNVVGLSYLRYMLQGDSIKFVPMPSGATTAKVWYTKAFTNLSGDADTFDGINGWEEFVIIDAAMKMAIKEESDISALMAQRQIIEARIDEMKLTRDMSTGGRINDVSKTMPWEFWSFGVMS